MKIKIIKTGDSGCFSYRGEAREDSDYGEKLVHCAYGNTPEEAEESLLAEIAKKEELVKEYHKEPNINDDEFNGLIRAIGELLKTGEILVINKTPTGTQWEKASEGIL